MMGSMNNCPSLEKAVSILVIESGKELLQLGIVDVCKPAWMEVHGLLHLQDAKTGNLWKLVLP